MEDGEDARIQERVVRVASVRCVHHNVCMVPSVDGILLAPHIVGRIVDAQDFVRVNTIVEDVKTPELPECVPIIWRGA